MIQVPVIVLSTLAGTASVGSATLFAGQTTASSIAIGLVSIAVGILNTLGGFFNYAKRAESHRIAHLHYSKISTKISIELSLPRLERISADSLLNYVRESMERLAETTPLAPEQILNNFNREFAKLKDEISMPPETNGLHKIKVYRSNGPIPTPVAFSLDAMENGEVSSTVADRLSALKRDQEETSRKLAAQVQEVHRLAMDQMKQAFLEKQETLEKQIKSMEATILPITEAQNEMQVHSEPSANSMDLVSLDNIPNTIQTSDSALPVLVTQEGLPNEPLEEGEHSKESEKNQKESQS